MSARRNSNPELGLERLRDRSRRPHVSPNATKADVLGKIVYLRRNYHVGPHKIAMHLKRYHDVQISAQGIWRIMKRLDMNRLPISQRYRQHVDPLKRYEKALPGHRVQIDVKFIAPCRVGEEACASRPLLRGRMPESPGVTPLAPAFVA